MAAPPCRGPVLLVEDDPIVALVARQILEDLGFVVTVASNGRTAVAAARSAGEAQDPSTLPLAIVDLGLPDMGGDEVIHALRAERPDLPVIIATGYDTAEVEATFGTTANLILLSKPYNGASLCAALRRLGFDLPE